MGKAHFDLDDGPGLRKASRLSQLEQSGRTRMRVHTYPHIRWLIPPPPSPRPSRATFPGLEPPRPLLELEALPAQSPPFLDRGGCTQGMAVSLAYGSPLCLIMAASPLLAAAGGCGQWVRLR